MTVKYFVDANKRTCVCMISVKKKYGNKSYTYSFKGKSKCSPDDQFNEATGIELAHIRALLKFKAWEKEYHQKSLDYLKGAIDYYNKKTSEIEEKQQKTINSIDRLTKEYSDLMDEL